MKVKVLHRNLADHTASRPGDIERQMRNRDPSLHPFEREREYARALVAVKLGKIFAKPLVASIDGHVDAVQCMARSHHSLLDLYTGSCSGELRMWNLSLKKCEKSIQAHDGFVRGICTSFDDRWIFSCGDDKKVKQWRVEKNFGIDDVDFEALDDVGHLTSSRGDVSNMDKQIMPASVFQGEGIFKAIDHHWKSPLFVTASDSVDVWDHHRSLPIHTFEWGEAGASAVRFNPAETSLLIATGLDNSVTLFDTRSGSPLRKVFLQLRSNAACWNPMQPMNFTVANEDHNLYTFDMRKLEIASRVHKDFTNAVLDVDYSPSGLEFVGASFDKTLRIFKVDSGRSRDVYHTRRMQHVNCCKYTADTRFVVSGSTDFCVRVWKSDASAPLGPRSFKERRALAYRNKLKERYEDLQEIKRIQRHHHVPAVIKKETEKKRVMSASKKRKEENVIDNAGKKKAEDSVRNLYTPERKKMIRKQEE